MNQIRGIILIISLLFLVSCATEENQSEVVSMKLTSPVFEHNGRIPTKYTCDGANINPPLKISDVPTTAKSLVLLMDDPDIPEIAKKNFNVKVWDHWVVFDIPSDVIEIKENQNPEGVMGRNTRGNTTYGGPCPPDREHRYFFKLYALDTMLNLKEGVSKKEVEKAMEGHVVAKTELMGRYERVKK